MNRNILVAFLFCTTSIFSNQLKAQSNARDSFFSITSAKDISDKNYGTINVIAGKHAMVIGTIMAYGENVKGLNVELNNGFIFKLAPAQTGLNLNYVGNSLNIVLQPGEKAKIEFVSGTKGPSVKQLYVSGQVIE